MMHMRLGVALLLLAALSDTAAAADTLIDDLLPKDTSSPVCYSARLEAGTINVEDWTKVVQVPVPGVFRFGKQVMRPEPALLPDQRPTEITLEIAFADRESDPPARIFDDIVRVSLEGWREQLFAAGDCTFAGKNDVSAAGTEPVRSDRERLICGADCDGGLFTIDRVAGSDDILIRFLPYTGGLRMAAGCSGGSYRVGAMGKDETVETAVSTAFRLSKVAAGACRPLRGWRERQ